MKAIALIASLLSFASTVLAYPPDVKWVERNFVVAPDTEYKFSEKVKSKKIDGFTNEFACKYGCLQEINCKWFQLDEAAGVCTYYMKDIIAIPEKSRIIKKGTKTGIKILVKN
jgi:hypothetical protein